MRITEVSSNVCPVYFTNINSHYSFLHLANSASAWSSQRHSSDGKDAGLGFQQCHSLAGWLPTLSFPTCTIRLGRVVWEGGSAGVDIAALPPVLWDLRLL